MKYISVVIILLIIIAVFLKVRLNSYVSKYSESQDLIKAYVNENSSLKESNRVFKLNIEQFKYLNDSILNKMDSIRKELKIKDKQLEMVNYQYKIVEKHDTIILNDTIFKDTNLRIDTIVGDKWVSTKLGLQYPSRIVINPKVTLENYIVINSKKETIDPPKKFFLFRWFQKKHTVLEVNVIEENPYVINSTNRFVQILK